MSEGNKSAPEVNADVEETYEPPAIEETGVFESLMLSCPFSVPSVQCGFDEQNLGNS